MDDRARVSFDRPAHYRILVQGWVSQRWAEWMNGMAMTHAGDDDRPLTTLVGEVADQSALLGLLLRLHNLGFVLLEARRL